MKRITNLFSLLLLLSYNIHAQDFDLQNFSEDDILGTARYVSMSGAFVALGGDVSAVVDNPAALGVFRHGELSLTMDFGVDKVSSGGIISNPTMRFTLPQVSWVANFDYSTKTSGLLYSSILLQYHRIKNFRRQGEFFGVNSPYSITDLMADNSWGLTEADMQDNWWDGNGVGTLSKLGYEGYLINPLDDDNNNWGSLLDVGECVDNVLTIDQRGGMDEFTFAWGGNISNIVYLGVGFDISSLSYERTATITEERYNRMKDRYSVGSVVSASGYGFDASLGLIVVPTDYLRLGMSYRTPKWMAISISSLAKVTSDLSSERNYFSYSLGPSQYTYLLPMQTSVGLAYMISQSGLLSVEYDWQHQSAKAIPDVHKLKLGGELVLKNNCFLRIGYAFVSPFMKEMPYFSPAYDDLRADTDYKNLLHTHYISAGVGFRNRYVICDIAYQCRIEKSSQYAFSRCTDDALNPWQHVRYDMLGMTHRVLLTLAWTRRK